MPSGNASFNGPKANGRLRRSSKVNAKKTKAQQQLFTGIGKQISAALESPVIREAGKAVGGKLKLPDVRGTAAREQLANPMQELFSHQCTKCRKVTMFSRADLLKIQQ